MSNEPNYPEPQDAIDKLEILALASTSDTRDASEANRIFYDVARESVLLLIGNLRVTQALANRRGARLIEIERSIQAAHEICGLDRAPAANVIDAMAAEIRALRAEVAAIRRFAVGNIIDWKALADLVAEVEQLRAAKEAA